MVLFLLIYLGQGLLMLPFVSLLLWLVDVSMLSMRNPPKSSSLGSPLDKNFKNILIKSKRNKNLIKNLIEKINVKGSWIKKVVKRD